MKNKFNNKRKKIFFNINIKLIIIICFVLFFIFYTYFNFHKLITTSKYFIQKYSDQFNYNLIDIKISNLKSINKNEILNFTEEYMGKSIFFVPIQKLSDEIYYNKWVKKLNIQSNYKDTLIITLEEENPIGIYQTNNQMLLFSENFIVLDIIDSKDQYLNLITFYGENSINESKYLLMNIDTDFKNMILSATYIENRRWNLMLKNLILLKLPEYKIKEAIKNYKKIYENFSNNDLNDVLSIDLRIKNQAIIKYRN